MAEQYTYAVARIHAMEASLLTGKDLEQILGAKNEQDAVSVLAGKGFDGKGSYKGLDNLLKEETEKTLELISKLIPDSSVLDVFKLKDDFHNLKAAVKTLFSKECDGIYVSGGTMDYEVIKKAVIEKNFGELSDNMSKAAEEAISCLAKTGDGQLADIIIDKAALDAIYKSGQDSDNETLINYSELFVALSDLKIAVRGMKLGKDAKFLMRAMAICKSMDISKLSEAAAKGEEELLEYLIYTPYSDSRDVVKKSYQDLEKWCDNRIMQSLKNQKSNPFTIAPIAAYYFAREAEIKAVRMVMSGVINHLDENLIKERLRDLYV